MLAPPPTADVEQDRARVSSEMQQIYTEAERAVDDEIERLDVAKKWAEGEMDRITAVALQKLDDGVDPDAVETQLQIDLEAVMKKAADPGFDPRKLAPSTGVIAKPPAVAQPPVAAPPPVPAPAPAPPPPATPSAVAADPTQPGCGCRSHRAAHPALAVLVLCFALGRARRR